MKRIIATLFASWVSLCLLCSSAHARVFYVKGYSGEDIQRTIDAAFEHGGGRVVVRKGVYNVGSLQLRSNIELKLRKGAVLLGAGSSSEYDSFPESICKIKPEKSSKVLIYAFNSSNIAITGKGMIDGQGIKFFDTSKYQWGFYAKPALERPRMVQFYNCDGITLKGVCFKDSPNWTMFIRFCSNIEIDGITVDANQMFINSDGIDFDGCSHVRVRNSSFKTGDDCLILRAMREYKDQHVVCEDIVVENCTLDSRCQAVRLGCPSDDTIKNARFRNISAKGRNGIFADFPTRYLSKFDNGYMDLSDIVFENFTGSFDGSAVQIVSEPGVYVRRVDGIVFRNFSVSCKEPLRFIGNEGHEIGNVLLENFSASISSSGAPIILKSCSGISFNNAVINGGSYQP